MREFAVSVLVNLRDRLSGGLNGIRRRLEQLRNLGSRLGLDRLGSALGRVVTQVGLVGAAAAAAFTALGGGALAAARSVAGVGDAAVKAASRVGASVEQWQELTYAAELSDVRIEGLSRALGILTRKAVEGDEMFGKLGIAIRDSAGQVRSSDELFKDLATLFDQLPDGAEKSALALKIFGEELGLQLIPMLNEGRAGLERLGQEARDLGIVLPEELALAAVDWNDNVTRLAKVFDGIKMEIFGPLIPVFNDLTVSLREFIMANKVEIVEAMGAALLGAAEALPAFIQGVRDGVDAVRPFAQGMATLLEHLGGIETVAIAVASFLSGKLIAALGAFGVALLTTPIGWFVAAMSGGVYLIKREWDDFAPHIETVMGGVRRVFEGDVAGIEQVLEGLSGFASTFGEKFTENLAPLADAASRLAAQAWADIQSAWATIDWGELGGTVAEGLAAGLRGAGRLARDLWEHFWSTWRGIEFSDLGRAVMSGLIEGTVAVAQFVVGFWASFLSAWRDLDFRQLGLALLRGLDAFAEGVGSFVIGMGAALVDAVQRENIPGKIGDAIVSGAGALIEAGAALIQALWDGIKAKFEELLVYVREIPGRIKDAIGSIDPIGDIRRGLGNWWNGEEAAEPAPTPPSVPAPGGPPQRQSSLDAPALAGARQLASARPAASGAAPRQERQEVAFNGELVVRVDGPGRVTSVQSSDPRVDIQPQRGASLGLA